MFLEPGVTEDDVLFPEPSHGELDMLGVPFVVDHHIDYAGDAARLVRAAVHVENRDGLRKGPDRKVAGDDILRVDEVSGRSAVNQTLHGHRSRGLYRLHLQRNVQGVPALYGINNVPPG